MLKEGPAGIRNAPGGLNEGVCASDASSPSTASRSRGEVGSPPAPAGPGRTDPQAYYETCKAVASLYEHPMAPELPRIKTPTVAIVGENDQTAGVGGTVKISRAIPGCKLVIVAGAGHGVYGQDFPAFRKELEELSARV